MNTYSDIRREYGENTLDIDALASDPLVQLRLWLDEAIAMGIDEATAFVLSTVDEAGRPDSRVLLMKDLTPAGPVFFTGYDSHKGQQLAQNPYAAMNFYWHSSVRQVRLRGKCSPVSREVSEQYFSSRPRLSQIATAISQQSQPIAARSELLEAFETRQKQGKEVVCPLTWGGYCLSVDEAEFFQGRNNRLNERIAYSRHDGIWHMQRLQP